MPSREFFYKEFLNVFIICSQTTHPHFVFYQELVKIRRIDFLIQMQALIRENFTSDIGIAGGNECFCILQVFRFNRNLDAAAACMLQRFFGKLINEASAINNGA